MTAHRARWSDNDHYLGPFTYARDTHYRSWAIELSSGDDEYPGNQLRLSGFGRTLIVALPAIIRPWRRKVTFSHITEAQRAEMIARSGCDWYWETHRREYGLSFSRSGTIGDSVHLSVHYGAQTHDSRTTQRWGCFLPWTQWRHVRHCLYDTQGRFFALVPDHRARLGVDGTYESDFEARRAVENACPTVKFTFADFDGQELEATTKIEEREWRHGDGWFKWLSWFDKPMIQRSLTIEFSGETGDRKGSWKGGITGTSINLLPSELHEAAFRRYCAKHQMSFGR